MPSTQLLNAQHALRKALLHLDRAEQVLLTAPEDTSSMETALATARTEMDTVVADIDETP